MGLIRRQWIKPCQPKTRANLARAGAASPHAARRTASKRLSQSDTWFQLAMFWSTIYKSLILND